MRTHMCVCVCLCVQACVSVVQLLLNLLLRKQVWKDTAQVLETSLANNGLV